MYVNLLILKTFKKCGYQERVDFWLGTVDGFVRNGGIRKFFLCNLKYFIKIFISHFANLEIFNKSGTMCTP